MPDRTLCAILVAVEIIGEKINGTRKRVARAIAERDVAWIADLAIKQVQAGAAWLDVNACRQLCPWSPRTSVL